MIDVNDLEVGMQVEVPFQEGWPSDLNILTINPVVTIKCLDLKGIPACRFEETEPYWIPISAITRIIDDKFEAADDSALFELFAE